MASKYDAHLERTVGVITKCDIVQNPSEVRDSPVMVQHNVADR